MELKIILDSVLTLAQIHSKYIKQGNVKSENLEENLRENTKDKTGCFLSQRKHKP